MLAGANPLAVDLASARLMDFDYRCLPLLSQGLAVHPLSLATFSYDDVACVCDDAVLQGPLPEVKGLNLRFRPHFGWQGHIELADPERFGNECLCVG